MRARLTRRAATLGALAATAGAVSGCAAIPGLGSLFLPWPRVAPGPVRTPDYEKIYGRVERELGPVPAFDYTVMDPGHLRANVAYVGPEPAGTIVVEPRRHALFLVLRDGRATRFGIAVGRDSGGWTGEGEVRGRRLWPDLLPSEPPPAAQAPFAPTEANPALRPGSQAPYGARLLALYSAGRDTGYRIHGTDAPDTIGSNVPTGCVRLINQDVIYLYRRAPEGTPIVVLA